MKEQRYRFRIKFASRPDFVGFQATMPMVLKRIEVIMRKNVIKSVSIEQEPEGIENAK